MKEAHSKKTDKTLLEITDRLISAYGPKRMYLFGSRARGSSRPNSDYDIMLIVADDAPGWCRKPDKAYQVLWGVRASVNVVVWTFSAFEEHLQISNSLPAEVVREGKILHAA